MPSATIFSREAGRAANPALKLGPLVGGLAASAIVAFFTCRLPIPQFASFAIVLLLVSERLLLVSLAGGITAWILGKIDPDTDTIGVRRTAVRTSLDALWLAPLAILMLHRSVLVIVPGALFAAAAMQSLCASRPEFRYQPDQFSVNSIFLPQNGSDGFRGPLFTTCVVLCVEASLVADFVGNALLTAMLVGFGLGLWVWRFADTFPLRHGRTGFHLATGIVLPFVLMLTPLLHYGTDRSWGKRFGFPFLHLGRGSSSRNRPGEVNHKPKSGEVDTEEQAHRGFILWPKDRKYTKVIPPAPTLRIGPVENASFVKPTVIPFNGVYWYFRPPDSHPPKDSHQEHGSPDVLSIHSNDLRALSMEAYQNFGELISTNCCREIQVAIRNADRYPGTVSLELILLNTNESGVPSQSLGRVTVDSTRPWKLYADHPNVSELLRFHIPTASAIAEFDEAKVIFRLDSGRSYTGARIAIDRFVLVPR